FGLLAGFLGPSAAPAQTPPPETYAGSSWDRPRLTGDWGGVRDQAAKRGLTLDIVWLQTLQGGITGAVNQAASYWGNAEYTLNVDTGKLGLWPGGFFTIYGMSSYGNSALRDSGALLPVSMAAILPSAITNDPATALMQLTYTQFLAKWFG